MIDFENSYPVSVTRPWWEVIFLFRSRRYTTWVHIDNFYDFQKGQEEEKRSDKSDA